MLGGHLDSWHAATGATDNAIGCAVMMEAARILKAIGVKPRRTIRVALWSGEEQGLLGSQGLREGALRHGRKAEAGVREVQRLLQRRFGARAASAARSIFGPPEAAADAARGVRAVRGPRRARRRRDDAAARAAAPTARRSTKPACRASASARTRSSISSYTWHTNLDTYERIVEDDVKKSAIAIAAAVYHVAMRDEMLPRFTKDQMPASSAPTRPVPAAPTTSSSSASR